MTTPGCKNYSAGRLLDYKRYGRVDLSGWSFHCKNPLNTAALFGAAPVD
jgi:hypothetical protein